MAAFVVTDEFRLWLAGLRDNVGKAHVANRVASAKEGSLGDWRSVGHGVIEMRIHYGPGYRVYLVWSGEATCIVLLGGSKATQRRDIKRAVRLARAIGGG
jgi:putative addiction module killer protein